MLKVLTQHDHVKAVWVKFDSEILQCFFLSLYSFTAK
jgi:hypothetical protein